MEAEEQTLAALPAGLEQPIAAFVRGLIAAGYSPLTVKASVGDLRQFATFVVGREISEVGQIARTDVTAFAAELAAPQRQGTRPYARSTIARKLSVVRSFLRFCEDNGLIERQSGRRRVVAEAASSPASGAHARAGRARSSRAIGGTKPLELRDRALFELIYSSGLRCQEALDLRLRDVSFDAVRDPGEGQGTQGARGARGRRRAERPRNAIWRKGGLGWSGVAQRGPCVREPDRAAAVVVGCAEASGPLPGPRRRADRHFASHAAPFVRHPPARGRRRSSGHPGAARPFVAAHHSGLRPRFGSASAQDLSPRASAGVRGAEHEHRPGQTARSRRDLAALQGARRHTGAGPVDPGLLAAGQVRGRADEQRPAGAHRRGRPGLVRPPGAHRRARPFRSCRATSSSRPTPSRGSRARSSTSCGLSTGCRARCGVGPARSRRR